MKDEVQAKNYKKLGTLLADMVERAFRNDKKVHKDPKRLKERVKTPLQKDNLQ